MSQPKGMTVWVYRTPGVDCTNGGISSRLDRLTLIGPGVPPISEPTEDAPAVYYDARDYDVEDGAYRPGQQLPPCVRPEPWFRGCYMMGGNFVYSSDSRFRDLTVDGGPIPLHDRTER